MSPKMPGPPPTPHNLRSIEGRRSQRAAAAEQGPPQLPAGAPAFPYFLQEIDAARVTLTLEGLTVEQLKAQAKAAGVKRYSRMSRAQLIEALAAVEEGPRARAWRYLLATLDPMQVVTPADGAALAAAVQALVEWVDIMRLIEREGAFWETTGRFGLQRKRHPALDQLNKTRNFFVSMLDRFGANPAYRAKVQIAANAAAQGSPWDELDDLGAEA